MYIFRKIVATLLSTIVVVMLLPLLVTGNWDDGKLLGLVLVFAAGLPYLLMVLPISMLIDLIMRVGKKRDGSSKSFGRVMGYTVLYAFAGAAIGLAIYHAFNDSESWWDLEWSVWQDIIVFGIPAAWLFAMIDYGLGRILPGRRKKIHTSET